MALRTAGTGDIVARRARRPTLVPGMEDLAPFSTSLVGTRHAHAQQIAGCPTRLAAYISHAIDGAAQGLHVRQPPWVVGNWNAAKILVATKSSQACATQQLRSLRPNHSNAMLLEGSSNSIRDLFRLLAL